MKRDTGVKRDMQDKLQIGECKTASRAFAASLDPWA